MMQPTSGCLLCLINYNKNKKRIYNNKRFSSLGQVRGQAGALARSSGRLPVIGDHGLSIAAPVGYYPSPPALEPFVVTSPLLGIEVPA
jgi:hypothetical protein